MSNFRVLSLKEQSESLKTNSQVDDDKYRSIFTYSSDLGPCPSNTVSSDKKGSKNKPSAEAAAQNMAKKYLAEYSKLSQKDEQEMGSSTNNSSAFDYKSIFSYSGPERYGLQQRQIEAGNKNSAADPVVVPGLSEKFVAKIALIFSYVLVFFTLPISIWFCFKTLPQWERIVIYRLGKLKGVKGPGNIFLIPWLDSCSKLDLRTQLMCHPLKQVKS